MYIQLRHMRTCVPQRGVLSDPKQTPAAIECRPLLLGRLCLRGGSGSGSGSQLRCLPGLFLVVLLLVVGHDVVEVRVVPGRDIVGAAVGKDPVTWSAWCYPNWRRDHGVREARRAAGVPVTCAISGPVHWERHFEGWDAEGGGSRDARGQGLLNWDGAACSRPHEQLRQHPSRPPSGLPTRPIPSCPSWVLKLLPSSSLSKKRARTRGISCRSAWSAGHHRAGACRGRPAR